MRRHGHELIASAVAQSMQTYAVESANVNLSVLLTLAEKGEEVLLTKKNRPIAKLVPVDDDEAYRREAQEFMGFLKGMRPFEREDDDRI